MPGIVTHHVFGIDVYKNLAEIIGDSSAALDAFLLGNLGPDPFFYLMATPATRKFRRIGQTMHKQKTPELLASIHEHLVVDAKLPKIGRSADARMRNEAINAVSHTSVQINMSNAENRNVDNAAQMCGDADKAPRANASDSTRATNDIHTACDTRATSSIRATGTTDTADSTHVSDSYNIGGDTRTVSDTDAVRDARGADNNPDKPRKAYALGFLCHYLLDSTVHPLVYAQQHAICNSSIEGLAGEWSHRVVHATIETALDEYILTTRLGATAATLPPHRTMLRCPVPTLMEVSRGYARALRETYGLRTPETIFFTAVNLNKLAQQALDSKSNGLRQRFDYLAGVGMASAYVLALSHRAEPRPRTPFTNDDHIAWEIPFSDGKTAHESFDELYAHALSRAIEVLPSYIEPAFGLDACQKLVGNVNFLGRTVEN